jgi:hypothetical protein
MRTQACGVCPVTENLAESEQGSFAPPSSEPAELSRKTDQAMRGTASNVVTSALGKVALAPMMAELDAVKKTLAVMAAGQVCSLSMAWHASLQSSSGNVRKDQFLTCL